MLDLEKLLKYNQLGLIPGPNETDEAFSERVHYCLSLKDNIPVCFESGEVINAQEVDLKSTYGFTPSWIPIIRSNYKLSLWQGACTWIFQEKEGSPKGTILQIRKKIPYSTEEVIAHELVHVGRMAFEEPKYEEILAYNTSASKFRKWWGPIIQSSQEAMLFAIILCLLIVGDFYALFTRDHNLFSLLLSLKCIPLAMIFYGIGRLWYRQKIFRKCLEGLKTCYGDKALSLIYRLTDKEIDNFSPEMLQKKEDQSPRWRLLQAIIDLK